MGLFLVRRERICSTRRISSSRPITGSSLPERACSLRFTAYLPSASNSCEAVGESTVAPRRKVRIASVSSFSAAPWRLSSSEASPRSARSPSRRCSTEAYLSLNFFVKSTARWTTREVSCAKNWSPAPSTRGSRSRACRTSSRRARTPTPARPKRNAARESSSRISAASRCIGSTACWPRSRARPRAACSASWALMVKVLMFIVVVCSLSFAPACRKMPATPHRCDSVSHGRRALSSFVTSCHVVSRHACHRRDRMAGKRDAAPSQPPVRPSAGRAPENMPNSPLFIFNLPPIFVSSPHHE